MTENQPIYGLVIVAHPDDESFLFAGTSLKLADEGKQICIICATHGEKGADRLHRNLSENKMAEIRTEELRAACKILNCSAMEYFDYPDGELENSDFKQLVDKLSNKIKHYAPAIILTFGHEGVSGHKDHIVIGRAAQAAARAAKHKVREIWLASIPASIIQSFNEHLAQRKVHYSHFKKQELKGVPDNELLMVDISKYAKQKHEALKAHQSQYLPYFHMFLEHECFEVIKP